MKYDFEQKKFLPPKRSGLKIFSVKSRKKTKSWLFWGQNFFCSKSYFLSFQVILEQKKFLTPQNFSKTQKFSKSPVLVNKVKILLNKVEILCYALFLEI